VTFVDSAIEYYKILLDIAVAATIAVVLVIFARRSRKQKMIAGYQPPSKDEKYIGYALLSAGITIMAISLFEVISILNSNYYSNIPFSLSGIQIITQQQTTDLVSGQLLGLLFAVPFWLLILICGGGKLVSLGMYLTRGTQVKIIKKLRT
jgi:hypothetical protein